MNTLFLTSFHPLISRNILSTPLLGELTKDPDVAVVLLVPDYKRDFFEREFGALRIAIAGLRFRLPVKDRLIRQLALAALKTPSMAIRRRWELHPGRDYLAFALKSALAWLMAGRAWSRRLVRWLDYRFGSRGEFGPLFDHHRPALVFATDIVHEADLACLRAARDRDVPVIGMSRSWDNLTGKGLLRQPPDIFMVQNEILKAKLERYHGISAERIRISGIPHYDQYLGYRPRPRVEFFAAIGLDPQKRLILFAPIGDRHIRENVTDHAVLDMLVRAHASGALPRDIQVLVRLPPTIPVALGDFMPPPWIRIEQPGQPFGATDGKERELDREDDRHLMESLIYSELLITGPSTIAIDAAVFDKPIILIAFDNGGAGYWESIRCWYDYDHFRPIVESGGARLAMFVLACLAAIETYLDRPETDREGRARIVREQLWRLDGKSTGRLVGALRATLDLPGGSVERHVESETDLIQQDSGSRNTAYPF